MANYKEAIRENWKFKTINGLLSVGQLFTASDEALIKLEEDLKEEVKLSKKPNRFQKSAKKDKTLKSKLDIVSDVIDTLIAEREEASDILAVKAEEQKLLGLLKEKEDEELKSLSKEELQKKLDKLRK